MDELQKMAQLFNLTADQIINHDGKMPKEVVIEDKSIVLKIIDTMLTKKKFKDFFQKNVAAL